MSNILHTKAYLHNTLALDVDTVQEAYPGQGDRDWERSRPNQMAAIICASGQRRFAELFLLILIKWAVKLVLK